VCSTPVLTVSPIVLENQGGCSRIFSSGARRNRDNIRWTGDSSRVLEMREIRRVSGPAVVTPAAGMHLRRHAP
jgi:hypothetical protein